MSFVKVTKRVPEPVTPPAVYVLELSEIQYYALIEAAFHLSRAKDEDVVTNGNDYTAKELRAVAASLCNNLPWPDSVVEERQS